MARGPGRKLLHRDGENATPATVPGGPGHRFPPASLPAARGLRVSLTSGSSRARWLGTGPRVRPAPGWPHAPLLTWQGALGPQGPPGAPGVRGFQVGEVWGLGARGGGAAGLPCRCRPPGPCLQGRKGIMGDPGLPGPQGLRGGMGDRVSGCPAGGSCPVPPSPTVPGTQRPCRDALCPGAGARERGSVFSSRALWAHGPGPRCFRGRGGAITVHLCSCHCVCVSEPVGLLWGILVP